MAVQKINIKEILGEEARPSVSGKIGKSKKSIGMFEDISSTAMAAMPLIPTKVKVIAVGAVALMIYGGVSLVHDIYKLIIH